VRSACVFAWKKSTLKAEVATSGVLPSRLLTSFLSRKETRDKRHPRSCRGLLASMADVIVDVAWFSSGGIEVMGRYARRTMWCFSHDFHWILVGCPFASTFHLPFSTTSWFICISLAIQHFQSIARFLVFCACYHRRQACANHAPRSFDINLNMRSQ
jgi:hypothetical protein